MPLTTPLRSFSISDQPDRGFAHPQHLNDRVLGDRLIRRVVGLRAVGEQHGVVPRGHKRIRVAAAARGDQLRLVAAAPSASEPSSTASDLGSRR